MTDPEDHSALGRAENAGRVMSARYLALEKAQPFVIGLVTGIACGVLLHIMWLWL